jgi:hypothetical protein
MMYLRTVVAYCAFVNIEIYCLIPSDMFIGI